MSQIAWGGPSRNRAGCRRGHTELLRRLSSIGVAGGMGDALVGEAARIAGRTLLTRDARARRTYELLGVDDELVD